MLFGNAVLLYFVIMSFFPGRFSWVAHVLRKETRTLESPPSVAHVLKNETRALESPPSSCSYDMAIIGAGGYIGSKLLHHFTTHYDSLRISVKGYDRDVRKFHRDPALPITQMTNREIPDEELQCFNYVVYLGGLSRRVSCDSVSEDEVYLENVEDILQLSRRMSNRQILIFASSAAIAEGSEDQVVDESFKVDQSILDRYAYSLFKREEMLKVQSELPTSPSMIGLRFGTVIGISPSQATDVPLIKLLQSAYTTGVLQVQDPDSYRSVLWMEDLARAVEAIVLSGEKPEAGFAVYHLSSFYGSIMRFANHIAWRTGARIKLLPTTRVTRGFSLSTTLFQERYNFKFLGEVYQVISELMGNATMIISGRSPRTLESPHETAACVICGATHLERVLDLGEQPLANEFHASQHDALSCTRYPLQLVTCPVCRHSQLSYIVPRAQVFEHYLYQSGTTRAMKQHFEWIADKVISELKEDVRNGTVLDIACNDGTQLDSFADRGWRTYGVDPAKNLVEISVRKGHQVFAEFWGARDIPELPVDIDAILAQNVLAHTDLPVHFMKHAAKVMRPHTRLYIQTSQCRMYQRGEFDTIYHEHISFFTAHSFHKLAELSGLKVVNFELAPIHGTSCLVTFQKDTESIIATHDKSIIAAMDEENALGLSHRWFYVQYEAHVLHMRTWMIGVLNQLQNKNGFEIMGYGAAAKAIVMLHFLMEDSKFDVTFTRILDDAPLKQNTYCPGTSIPVQSVDHLLNTSSETLVIVVFAWNFFDEVVERIASHLALNAEIASQKSFFILRPFPVQELFRFLPDIPEGHMRLEKVLENFFDPVDFKRPLETWKNRKKVIMTTHFFNEELLMPQFIRNHAPMFDEVVLIDNGSNDSSVDIIRSQAPPSWRVIPSRSNVSFEADGIDQQVMDVERSICSGCWRVALTTTEFLIHPNLRQRLATLDPSWTIFKCPDLWMVGPDVVQYNPDLILPAQRYEYAVAAKTGHNARRLHCIDDLVYILGRHETNMDGHLNALAPWLPGGMLFKYIYTPWPDIIARKLQIGARIPLNHLENGWGVHHTRSREQMEKERAETMREGVINLRDIPLLSEDETIKMYHRIWMHFVGAGPELLSTFKKRVYKIGTQGTSR